MLRSVLTEAYAEAVNRIGLDLETGSRGVAAVAEQVFATGMQRFVQRKAGHRPARTLTYQGRFAALLAQANQKHRAPKEIDQPAGDDADDARVPIRIGQDERRRAVQIMVRDHFAGAGQNLALILLPLLVLAFQEADQVHGALR